MNKRGFGHVEFILSFVIFVGFILFAFVFFNPLQSQRTIKSTVDYAWLEIADETKEKVETYSVLIDQSFLNQGIEIDIVGIPLQYNASVEDFDGNQIDAYRDAGGSVYFNTGDKDFFRITYSPAIRNSPLISGTVLIPRDRYIISSSKSEELYFESLLLDLNKTYFSDYNSLKQTFNLPNKMDFGFSVKFSDSEIDAIRSIPEGLDVLSKSDRVEVIRNDGKREYAEVRVLAW